MAMQNFVNNPSAKNSLPMNITAKQVWGDDVKKLNSSTLNNNLINHDSYENSEDYFPPPPPVNAGLKKSTKIIATIVSAISLIGVGILAKKYMNLTESLKQVTQSLDVLQKQIREPKIIVDGAKEVTNGVKVATGAAVGAATLSTVLTKIFTDKGSPNPEIDKFKIETQQAIKGCQHGIKELKKEQDKQKSELEITQNLVTYNFSEINSMKNTNS